jgi:hypothetical protein
LFGVVLFLHIAFVVAAFAMAGVMHAAMPALGRARDVAAMRPWAEIVHRLDPLFPLVALGVLGLGVWLVHLGEHTDDGFRYSDGWVITAIVSLVVIEGLAGALLAKTAKRLVALVHESPDGPPNAELRALTRDPRIWHVGHIATFGFLGIVFLMAAKPSGAYAPIFPIVGALVGVALSRAQLAKIATTPAGTGALPTQRTTASETTTGS